MVAGRSRPPFEPGHQLSLRHGAYSEQAIAERAKDARDRLFELAPWTSEAIYAESVQSYVRAMARSELAHQALMTGAAKVSPRLLEAATSAARLAWMMGDQLGLTPSGHARLKILFAGASEAEQSLADLAAEGAEAWARRRALEEP